MSFGLCLPARFDVVAPDLPARQFPHGLLHNQMPVEIQTRLHLQGKQRVLLPMNVG
ncbi:hypothetical protein [Paraburkholderia acidipaludis]|uniref:hypothetical protein n=1 Tax=Paraburkholderia acidipaludis TaxID=660537 RepID=UPI000B1C1D85|nr:hypothetical protein [Paraburkholderia acidipaludis]